MDGWADSLDGTPRLCAQFSWNNGGRWSEYIAAQITATSETTYTLGGPNTRWGWNWNPADFNNGNFRMRIIMDAANADRDFFLEYAAVRVHYQ